MTDRKNETEEIAELAGQRAENLFKAHRLCCASSVLLVINQGFRGEFAPETAISLGAGFCGGIGDCGCLCGALAGAVAAIGLFLAPNRPAGLRKKRFRNLIKKLHDRFNEHAGSTCCRNLIAPFVDNSKGRNEHCKGLTGLGAQLTAELLLKERPDFLSGVDLDFLRQHDSRIVGLLKSFS